MENFLISSVVVALSELGDKTQMLALLLAAKYRPICTGALRTGSIKTVWQFVAISYLGHREPLKTAQALSSFVSLGLATHPQILVFG